MNPLEATGVRPRRTVRYQAALRPDSHCDSPIIGEPGKPNCG
jgi:hypothetical protein